jgi:hypothetical protein
MNLKINWLHHLYIFLLAILLTALFHASFLKNPYQNLSCHEDCVLISWVIDQTTQNLQNNQPIYQLPFFHPYQNTLTFSEPYLTTALLNIPISHFENHPFFIYNLHLMIATALIFLASYFLGKHLFEDHTTALIVAVVFTFLPLRFDFIHHLHSYSIAGLPLSLLFLLKWQKSGQTKHLFWLSLVFVLQALNAVTTIYPMIFVLAIFSLKKKFWQVVVENKIQVASAIGTVIATLGWFYMPYWQTARELGVARSIRDAAHHSLSLENIFKVDLIFLFVVILALYFYYFVKNNFWQKTSLKPKFLPELQTFFKDSLLYWLTILTGLIFSLGPVLKIAGETFKVFGQAIPLPYALAYYLFTNI